VISSEVEETANRLLQGEKQGQVLAAATLVGLFQRIPE
jgi:hypothetical protein